jgi:hypothetical protein
VLHPRTTGFVYIFNELNATRMINHIDDVTVAYDGGVIPRKEIDFLTGDLPSNIHFYMDTFECEKILLDKNASTSEGGDGQDKEQTNKALEVWLKERWRIKESMLVSFYKNKETCKFNKGNNNGSGSTEENEFDRNFQSLYETQNASQFKSNLIYAYPAYWLVTMIGVSYLIYTYLLFKLYIMSAFLFFFVYVQLMGKHFDHWIVDSRTPILPPAQNNLQQSAVPSNQASTSNSDESKKSD